MIDTSNLFSSLEDLCSSNRYITILGDLNIPHVVWTSRPPKALDAAANALVEFHEAFNMSQPIPGATRGSSVLDIILTTEPLRYHSCNIEEPMSSSDHNAIVCSISCSDSIRTAVYQRHATYKKINYVELEHELPAIDWSAASYQTCDVNALWNSFQATLFNALTRCTPCRVPGPIYVARQLRSLFLRKKRR